MPCSFVVVPSRHIIVAKMKDHFSLEDFLVAVQQVQSHKDFDPSFDVFVHFPAAVKMELSQGHINKLLSIQAVQSSSRRAYVVQKDLHFGMLRMYESYRKREDEDNFCVFRDIQSALVWLNQNRSAQDVLTEDDIIMPD